MAANASRKIEKITLGEMRSSGVRGLLIYCSDYRCSHYIAISGDRWPDNATERVSRSTLLTTSLA
jgi:hypothetical protein